MANKCAFISFSYVSNFSFILLNFRFKLYVSLNHISVYWPVSLIMKVFQPLVTSFRLYFIIQTLHIYILVTSMIHVHYDWTASPTQNLCHLDLLSKKIMSLCCLYIYSIYLNHIILILIWEYTISFVNYLLINLCLVMA